MDILLVVLDLRFWSGAILAIFLREVAVWIPGQKDRRIEHLEKLIFLLWGPLTNPATRLVKALESGKQTKLHISVEESTLIVRATNQLPHELSGEDTTLIHEFMGQLEEETYGLQITKPAIAEQFVETVIARWIACRDEIVVLREMRKGFFSRWLRTPKGKKLKKKANELLNRGPLLYEISEESVSDLQFTGPKERKTGFLDNLKRLFGLKP